jgi:hypothetical protein
MLSMKVRAALAGLFGLVAMGVAPQAQAVDGVILISQSCALTGCFAGDAAGFPVIITRPGSYRLSSNLDVGTAATAANTTGVEIQVNGVTLDLNGFTISGPATCTNGACTSTGTGIGVAGNGQGNRQETAIRNGVIRRMGGDAIQCDRGCTVEGVRMESNGGGGIVMFNGPGVVRGNVSRNNGRDGIFGSGVISQNIVERNGGNGIFGQGNSAISGNVVSDNGGIGIRCNRCTALDNNVLRNRGFGLVLFTENTSGAIMVQPGATLLQIDANVCDFDTVCP